MQRFTLSAFSVLLAAWAIAPAAEALPKVDSDFNLHTQRLAELDSRNKSEIKSEFNLQAQRLAELDSRNKSEIKSDFTLHTQRLAELDARNKSESIQKSSANH